MKGKSFCWILQHHNFSLKIDESKYGSSLFKNTYLQVFIILIWSCSNYTSSFRSTFYLRFCRSINFTSHIARSLAHSLAHACNSKTKVASGPNFFLSILLLIPEIWKKVLGRSSFLKPWPCQGLLKFKKKKNNFRNFTPNELKLAY